MNVTLQQTEKLLRGSHTFSQLGFSLLLTRLKWIYSNDPSALQTCAGEVNVFIEKYQAIMSGDCDLISKL